MTPLHGRRARFRASYEPVFEPQRALPGTLEYFLAERYCLYTALRTGIYRTEIHHLPWPLQRATAEIAENSMAAAAGLALPPGPAVSHFSRRLKVLLWRPRRVGFG